MTVVEEKVAAGMSTAVLVPDATYDDWLASLRSADLAPGDGRDGDFAAKVTVVPQSGCKGLEFDAVVLVEPAELAAESLHPPRALYVAMTRCTQDLTVVHAAPLPPGLAAPAPSPLRRRTMRTSRPWRNRRRRRTLTSPTRAPNRVRTCTRWSTASPTLTPTCSGP